MYTVDKNTTNRIIQEVDIVSLVQEDITLEKKGSNFIGLCPFHQDTNPSFTVSPEKKIYKCFVCGKGGNVINYIQEKRHLSYIDTLQYLASSIGIDVQKKKQVELKPEHFVLADAKKYYNTVLSTMKNGAIGREYLKQRGYNKEIILEFGIGYAPGDNKLIEYFKNQIEEHHNYDEYAISKANVTTGEYEFFRNRLIFPILDDEERVVGFSARTLKEDTPKYLNSKDSAIFQKKNILYNLQRAKKYLNEDTLIVVEGFFDVIALSKHNINNVIALMGTAFTNNHISLLKKHHVKNIVLCLDQDEAGKKTTIKMGELLLKHNFNDIKVIEYSDYKDIDEYIKSNNGVDNLFTNKKDYFEFKIDKLQEYYNLNSLDGKSEYTKVVTRGLDQLNIEKQEIIKSMVSNIVGFDVKTIKPNEVEKSKPPILDQGPSQFLTSKKNNVFISVPTNEDILVKYAMESQEKCMRVNQYIIKQKYKFEKHKDLFDFLKLYYEKHDVFEEIEFMNICQSDKFLIEIKNLKSSKMYDVEKIELIFNNVKNTTPGRNIFRKKGA